MSDEAVDVSTSVSRGRLVHKNVWGPLSARYFFSIAAFALGASLAAFDRRPGEPWLLYVDLPVMAVALLAAGTNYRSLRLESLEIPGREEQLFQMALEAVGPLGWTILAIENNYLVAVTPPTAFTWGQLVTVIAQPNRLYWTSRNCSGPRGTPPFSFGLNAKHVAALRARLQEAAPPANRASHP